MFYCRKQTVQVRSDVLPLVVCGRQSARVQFQKLPVSSISMNAPFAYCGTSGCEEAGRVGTRGACSAASGAPARTSTGGEREKVGLHGRL